MLWSIGMCVQKYKLSSIPAVFTGENKRFILPNGEKNHDSGLTIFGFEYTIFHAQQW